MPRPKGAKDSKPRKPRVPKVPGKPTSKSSAQGVLGWVPGTNLTFKQAFFVSEYLKDGNAKQAAIRARYAEKSAGSASCQLMGIPKIKTAIQEAMDAQMIRTTVTADKLIAELANIAFSRPTAVMTWGPDGVILKDSSTMSADDVALVSEVSETKGTDKGGGSMRVKLHDKMKALELLGKHLGIFQDVSRIQVQEMPEATMEEHKNFQEVANRAMDRWKSQGLLNGPKKT